MERLLLAALIERFGGQDPRVGAPPDPLVVFPARHPEVGDVRIWSPQVGPSSIGEIVHTQLSIGEIIFEHFQNFDTHLDLQERGRRHIGDVVRFLQELFADRLLFWKSTDDRNPGWRERGDTGGTEPLVSDDRTYRRYLWSGPLGEWRVSSSIFARGWVRDEREHQILLQRLAATGSDEVQGEERELAVRLIEEYERSHAV